MTEIQNPKQKNNRLETVWNLRPARSCLAMAGGFIYNLVLGVCDLKHQTPRQSRGSPPYSEKRTGYKK
jgi:hypothetical protein